MNLVLQTILTLLLLTAVAYVHRQIPVFTKGRGKKRTAHAILILVGIAFGLTRTAHAVGEFSQIMAFLVGFGLVHLPAAIILFIKSRRGEGKS